MAACIVFVCDACSRTIEAWDDGNPSFETAEGTVTAGVIALTHPSLRHLSIARRVFGPLRGNEAEIEMLRRAAAPGV